MSSSLTVDDLRAQLSQLGLSTRGHRPELRARLKRSRIRQEAPPALAGLGEMAVMGSLSGISTDSQCSSAGERSTMHSAPLTPRTSKSSASPRSPVPSLASPRSFATPTSPSRQSRDGPKRNSGRLKPCRSANHPLSPAIDGYMSRPVSAVYQNALGEASTSSATSVTQSPSASRLGAEQELEHYDSFLVLDVEATCERGPPQRTRSASFDWPNEIIELPVILLQWKPRRAIQVHQLEQRATASNVHPPTSPAALHRSAGPSSPASPKNESYRSTASLAQDELTQLAGLGANKDAIDALQTPSSEDEPSLVVVDTFHTFVRPTWRPRLTRFCRELTGIDQSTIDAAPTFPAALDALRAFLSRHSLLEAPTGPRSRPLPARSRTNGSSSYRLSVPSTPSSPAFVSNAPSNTGTTATVASSAGVAERPIPALRRGVTWVTHGPFDLRDFVVKQSFMSGFDGPPRFMRGPLIDVRKSIQTLYDVERPLPTEKWGDHDAVSAPGGKVSEQAAPGLHNTEEGTTAASSTLYDFASTNPNTTAATSLDEFLPVEHLARTRTQKHDSTDTSASKRRSTHISSAGMQQSKKAPIRDTTISGLLAVLKLQPFEGRLHSGMDDTRNIARLMQDARRMSDLERRSRLLKSCLLPNVNLEKAMGRRWHWMGDVLGQVSWDAPEERDTDVEDAQDASLATL
ncbi:Predicted exonuclease [Ceraceosorus bombacis]|uniref:Predicted exonuclease n=1 Tax=Ceraceosorus bombacis TaxID=401625 RepID=A0A0P1BT94_9BASI|nr:Predicted exonuclease [Ceraceosorus bombacis]